MTSTGEIGMPNEKLAATMNGSRRAGKNTLRAYAIGHAHGDHREIPDLRDWECAQRWLSGELEPTGERIWDKLTGGSEYATVTVRDAEGRVVQEDQIPFEHVGHGSLQYDPARDSAGVIGSESLQVRQKRDWSPTKGELAVAMGIVLFIIAIFVFVVTYYKL